MSPSMLPNNSSKKLPLLLQAERADFSVTLRLKVPATLSFFSGHFPGHPILPGVVQIDWAILFGRQYFPLPASFQKMEALKFQAIIEPAQEISLLLEYRPSPASNESGKLIFNYESERGRHSSGRIVFASQPASGLLPS